PQRGRRAPARRADARPRELAGQVEPGAGPAAAHATAVRGRRQPAATSTALRPAAAGSGRRAAAAPGPSRTLPGAGRPDPQLGQPRGAGHPHPAPRPCPRDPDRSEGLVIALLAAALLLQQGRAPEVMLAVDRDRVTPGGIVTFSIRVTSDVPDPIR